MKADHVGLCVGDLEAELLDIEGCREFWILCLNQNIGTEFVRHVSFAPIVKYARVGGRPPESKPARENSARKRFAEVFVPLLSPPGNMHPWWNQHPARSAEEGSYDDQNQV